MKKRLLYIEDNEDNVYMLQRRLSKRGYEVLIARDGESGFDMALAERPDLIIMDLLLPGEDGWQITARLKAEQTTCNIPVIALSSSAMETDQKLAMDSGCEEFEAKPVNIERLVEKIERNLA